MPDDTLDRLWLAVLQEIVDMAAHELKDVLNGVSLNLEVVRSRSGTAAGMEGGRVAPFAVAAADQLAVLTDRVEALLFLGRPARNPADVALALRHLAALLVPATRSDGCSLAVTGYGAATPTSVRAQAVRLALGSSMLVLTKRGGNGLCGLSAAGSGSATVVRFSHESAAALDLDPEIAAAIVADDIHVQRSDGDLLLEFPGP
ncbi:MAG: hypothetical protein WD801_03160 [Gemmatimonadaceae bacterium]